VAIATKVGLVHRSQARDFYTRTLTIKNHDSIFVEAREFDIPYMVSRGQSALGITYESDFFEYTQVEARAGVRAENLEVLLEFPFGFQLITAVAARYSRRFDDLRVLVPPTLLHTCDLVLGGLTNRVHKVCSFSIPQELSYLGTGALGIDKIALREDFEGDIGEDGRPYIDYFEKLQISPVKGGRVDGEEFSFRQIVNKPILIGNTEGLEIQSVKETADKISQRAWRRRELKRIRVQTSSEKEVRIRPHDKSLLCKIMSSGYRFVHEAQIARAYDPSSTVAIVSIGNAQANVRLMNKLRGMGINPKTVTAPTRVARISLAKKLSKLCKRGYEVVIFDGPRERERGSLSVKDLRRGKQVEVDAREVDDVVMHFFLATDEGRPARIILIQEMGFPKYERRLFGPGRDYVSNTWGLAISPTRLPLEEQKEAVRVVRLNYRDMLRLLFAGVADEAVLGYDRFINEMIELGLVDELITQANFNDYAALKSLPLRIRALEDSKCKLVLAADNGEGALGDLLHTEYAGIGELLVSNGELDSSMKVKKISGCAEAFRGLVLDAIRTGRSLQENGKHVLREVLDSSAIVATRKAQG
jgi:ATP phosphoribosyltransferase